jgi:hypothetical protein
MHATPHPLMHTLRRRCLVWLALCLAWLGALVPTVSHTLVWAHGDTALVQICSTTGQRWVTLAQAQGAANQTDGTQAPDPAKLLNHCPFCLLAAERLAAPPTAALGVLSLPGRAVSPVIGRTVFSLARLVWAPPLRGPPMLLNF